MSASNELPPNFGDELTFADLAEENKNRELAKHGEAKGRTTHASDMTSLRRYLRVNNLEFDDLIKDHLAITFSIISERIKDDLLSSSYSDMSKYVYLSRMKKINNIAFEMYGGINNEARSLSEVLTMALNKRKIDEPNLTKAELARRVGLSPQRFGDWYTLGRRRPRASEKNTLIAKKLENLLDLKKDSLIVRLVPIHRSKFVTARQINAQRFGDKKEVNLVEIPYRAQTLPPKIAKFFEDYVCFKTVAGFKKDILGNKMYTGRYLWRVKKNDNGFCATALKKLINIQTYVGWLMLPSSIEGARAFIDNFCKRSGKVISPKRRMEMAQYFIGCGLPDVDIHPIHLVNPDYLERFIVWMNFRGHQNRRDFIDDAFALINESSGFLSQQVEYVWDYPNIGLRLINTKDICQKSLYVDEATKWKALCYQWRKELTEMRKFINKKEGVIGEKLKPILIKSDILFLLRNMVERHASDRPPAQLRYKSDGSVSLAVWIRDQLLLRKLISNPLRGLHFAEMTYRDDNTGNLRKCPERGWRLTFKPEDFKNQRGAAREHYDVGIPESLWPLIDVYLNKARPILLRNKRGDDRSEKLFLSKDGNGFNGGAISQLIYKLTARFGNFDVETVGIRTHAFRHLIATAWLRNHRYDYYTVAKILHDDLYTVIRKYSHDGPDDVLSIYQKELAIPTFCLTDQRGAA